MSRQNKRRRMKELRRARAAAKLLATPTREQLKRAMYAAMYGASKETIAGIAPNFDYTDFNKQYDLFWRGRRAKL